MEKEHSNSNTLKKIFSLPLYCVLAFALMLIGGYVGILTGLITKAFPSLASNNAWLIGEQYLEFWGIWAVFFLCLLIPVNKPLINAVNKKAKGNTFKKLGLGILIGFGLNGICALTAILHKDIYLTFETFNILPFILLFIAVFIQSSAEELICRCFLYQHLRRLYKNPWIAIIGNFVLFGLGHLANNGITPIAFLNIMLTGLLFSLFVYYFDSLWCAFGIHAGWNFTQNILLGLPNSGMITPYSIFKLDAVNARSSFFYNIAFGIEGSGISCVVLAIACIIVILIGNKKGPSTYNIWEEKVN